MKGPIVLSPLGTAREGIGVSGQPVAELDLLSWLGQVREQLKTLYNLEEEVAFLAWELARWQPGLEAGERQALILLILTALIQERQGSTRIPFRSSEGRSLRLKLAQGLLGPDGLSPSHAVEWIETMIDSGRASTIVGTAGEFKPLVVDGPYLYLQKMLHLEDRFVEALHRRLDAAIPPWSQADSEEALRDVLERSVYRNGSPVALASEQKAAVRAAVRYPITIVSGGPGTGKTTIVLSILRVLRRLGVACEEFALAAPTGKAANRMGEAIQAGRDGIANPSPEDLDLDHLAEPRTLHRLLGYLRGSGRFLHHENNRLAERVVIVDEGSMIDLAMMERLARSLRDDSRFILLGDAHQLPSVEAGAVLRDLLGEAEAERGSPLGPRAVPLIQSYRMRRDDDDGRNILTVAQAIDAGNTPTFAPSRTSENVIVDRLKVSDVEFHGVEFVSAPDGSTIVDEFLDRWHREKLRSLSNLDKLVNHEYTIVGGHFGEEDQNRLRELFGHWARFRILCVTRVLRTSGADGINAALHQRALDQRASNQRKQDQLGFRRDDDDALIPGEPVMMTVNDSNRMLFNGDQGLILDVSDGGRAQPMAVFPRAGDFAAFHLQLLKPDLLHSYAMTVHKAQGSEFDCVSLFLPDRDIPINTREVLYTALTRSRSSAVIVGRRDILELGIDRAISRDSGIAEKLRTIPRQ
jgi:exodeoxyribonuclease V alpha subunit